MKKILLLNPPSRDLMFRDTYCGESTKAGYYWAPIDLLVLSGILSNDHDVSVLDATVERLCNEEALERVGKIKPEIVIFLTSAPSFKDDLYFLKMLKEHFGPVLFGSGDILLFRTKWAMENYPLIDGILLDFSSGDILRFINHERDNLSTLVFKENGNIICPEEPFKGCEMKYPMPRHELFPLEKYSIPFSKRVMNKTTSVSTNFGCPHSCSFCQFGNINFKQRDIGEFIEELRYVKDLGVQGVFIRDLTFGPSIKRGKEICRQMIKNKLNLAWNCEARNDSVDEELLDLMKESGCCCVMFGVESGSSLILNQEKKKTTIGHSERIFDYCDRINLPTLAHFVLGLPGDTAETINETISFSKKLKTTYASFNYYVPRVGTEDRDRLVKQGVIDCDDLNYLDSSASLRSLCKVDEPELRKLFRKANLTFYLRPMQIYRILQHTRFSVSVINGWGLIKGLFTKRKQF